VNVKRPRDVPDRSPNRADDKPLGLGIWLTVGAAGVLGASLRSALRDGWTALAPSAAFALAAACGVWLRIVCQRWIPAGRLPWGTLSANLAGSALLAVVFAAGAPATLTHVLAVGFCGSLTTFSGFVAELDDPRRRRTSAVLYLAVSCVVGLAVCWPVAAGVGDPDFRPTAVANLAGCFLFGLLDARLRSPTWRIVCLAGLLGGLTTFSALVMETAALARHGREWSAVANLGLQVACGWVLLRLGKAVGAIPQRS
jgi:CrcB protein